MKDIKKFNEGASGECPTETDKPNPFTNTYCNCEISRKGHSAGTTYPGNKDVIMCNDCGKDVEIGSKIMTNTIDDKDKLIIVNPKYKCPKHGIVNQVITIDFEEHKDLNGDFCLLCWAEWTNAMIPKVTKIDEEKKKI